MSGIFARMREPLSSYHHNFVISTEGAAVVEKPAVDYNLRIIYRNTANRSFFAPPQLRDGYEEKQISAMQ